MNSLLLRSGRFWLGMFAALVSLACVLGWLSTRNRNAWATGGGLWPQYVAVHYGRVGLFSTLWRRGSEGRFAWHSRDWIYDAIGSSQSRYLVQYSHIGDAYGGTPTYTARMHALFVPLWYPAAPLALWSWYVLRVARREVAVGRCVKCGYSREGLPPLAPCPECGSARVERV